MRRPAGCSGRRRGRAAGVTSSPSGVSDDLASAARAKGSPRSNYCVFTATDELSGLMIYKHILYALTRGCLQPFRHAFSGALPEAGARDRLPEAAQSECLDAHGTTGCVWPGEQPFTSVGHPWPLGHSVFSLQYELVVCDKFQRI